MTPERLHANESVDGLTDAEVAAVIPLLRTGNRYPTSRPADLAAAIAALEGVGAEQVVCGPGSLSLCLSLCLAARLGGQERVVVAVPSFDGYTKVAAMAGLPVTTVALRDHVLDLPAFARELADSPPALVFLPNPNNPTSTALHREQLRAFLMSVPQHLVVVDEAYLDYDVQGARRTCRPLLSDHPNLVVLRTASKADGLAGVRLGYCLAQEPLAREIAGCVVDYAVSGWVELLGVRRIGSTGVQARVADTRDRRAWLVAELAARGFAVPPPSANFVWLPLGTDSVWVAARVADANVLVKAYPGEGVRVSVGERAALATFLDALPSYSDVRKSST